MELLENLQKLKKQLSRADFERRFPHPWLIRELADDERPALFRTMVTNVKRTPPSPLKRPIGSGGMAALLGSEPGRFGLYPIAKSGTNPWSDRILVGRAANNDIVLRNDRISKLHAYFQTAKGVWKLHDARSANGTRVDGTVVPPGDAGTEIQTGNTLMFGTITAEIIDSGELYDSL